MPDFLQNILDWLYNFLSILFVPASAFGAIGAIQRGVKEKETGRQLLFRAVGGCVIVSMAMPVVADYLPQNWLYTAAYLCGWIGVEGVSWLAEQILTALGKRAQKKISGE